METFFGLYGVGCMIAFGILVGDDDLEWYQIVAMSMWSWFWVGVIFASIYENTKKDLMK